MVETVKLLMHSLFTAWYHTTGGDETQWTHHFMIVFLATKKAIS